MLDVVGRTWARQIVTQGSRRCSGSVFRSFATVAFADCRLAPLHCRSPCHRVGATVLFSSCSDAPTSPPSEMDGGDCREHYHRISFLTDVEGDAAYFDRFVENSRVLAFRYVEPRFGDGNGSGDDPTSSSTEDDEGGGGGYFPYDKEVIFLDDHEDRISEEDKAAFVYGGDVWDKGGADLYVIRQLLSLRRRYGERVQFIMGNRDINKMRIVPELGLPGTGQGRECLPRHGGVFWLQGTGLVGDPLDSSDETEVPSESAADRLRWILGKTMGSPDAFEFRRSELQRERDTKSATKGEESLAPVSDSDVVESYRTTCHPTRGVLGQYLAEAKLVVQMGEVMFLHGALPVTPEVVDEFLMKDIDGSLSESQQKSDEVRSIWSSFDFAMPWKAQSEKGEKPIGSAAEWVLALNSFAKDMVSAWSDSVGRWEQDSDKSLTGVGIWSTQGGYGTGLSSENKFGSLLQYGMGWTPNKQKNPTVVYASWSDDGMPRRFYDDGDTAQAYRRAMSDFFDSAKVRLMVTGHQPNGDMPLAVRVPTSPIPVSGDSDTSSSSRMIVACDTSYSGDTHWINNGNGEMRINRGRGDIASGRGDVAVSELLVTQRPADGRILGLDVHGVLSDGSSYEWIDPLCSEENGAASVGALVDRSKFVFEGSVRDDSSDKMDWWVKAKLSDSLYLVSSGKGYEVWNSVAHRRRGR